MTPNQIAILIHYHINNRDPHPNVEAPAVRDAVASFIREGILEPILQGVHPMPAAPTYGPHQTTRKGAALIKLLCATPMPVEQWVDPRSGSVIETGAAPPVGASRAVTECSLCSALLGGLHKPSCATNLGGKPFGFTIDQVIRERAL